MSIAADFVMSKADMDFSIDSQYLIYTQPYIAAKASLQVCLKILNTRTRYKEYIHILRNTAAILNACADSIEYKDKDIEKF